LDLYLATQQAETELLLDGPIAGTKDTRLG
jgi:hypothetical protein